MHGRGDVAHLVECWTGMPLRQVHFVCAARDFTLSQLSAQTLMQCLHSPHVQSRALTSVHRLKILSIGCHTFVVWTKVVFSSPPNPSTNQKAQEKEFV